MVMAYPILHEYPPSDLLTPLYIYTTCFNSTKILKYLFYIYVFNYYYCNYYFTIIHPPFTPKKTRAQR